MNTIINHSLKERIVDTGLYTHVFNLIVLKSGKSESTVRKVLSGHETNHLVLIALIDLYNCEVKHLFDPTKPMNELKSFEEWELVKLKNELEKERLHQAA